MTKGFYFGNNILKAYISRLLDFALSQPVFRSPLLRIFSKLLQVNYSLLNIIFLCPLAGKI